MITEKIIFNKNPTDIICFDEICPPDYAILLGRVPTGIMKAQDAAKATPSKRPSAPRYKLVAILLKIGMVSR